MILITICLNGWSLKLNYNREDYVNLYISQKIKDEYKQWKAGDIVFINSGTGTGKSHFIRNELSDWALGLSTKVLFLSNRKKLKQQNIDELEAQLNTTVIPQTYQLIEQVILNGETFEFDQYEFIVCDECHYFIQDSLFNDNSDLSWNAIMKLDSHVRIFMSATAESFFEYMATDHIQNDGNDRGRGRVWKYFLKRNFDSVRTLSFYSEPDTLLRYINEKLTSNSDKVLWFCKSIDQAVKLHKMNADSSFLCSTSQQNKKYFKYLSDDTLIKEKEVTTFKGKWLFTTKVLDNGFDLKDENIRVIVCDDFDITTIIQCIGRKRFKNEKDYVHVVLLNYSNKSIGGFMSKLKQITKEANAFISGGTTEWLKVVGRFNRKSNFIIVDSASPNSKLGADKRISRAKYLKTKSDLQVISQMIENNKDLNKWRSYNAETPEKDAWAQYMVSLLNKNRAVYIDQEYQKIELVRYLDSIVGQVMLTLPDRKELIEKLDVRSGGRQRKSIDLLNADLKERKLNYYIKEFETSRMIEGRKKKYKSAWQLYRLSDK